MRKASDAADAMDTAHIAGTTARNHDDAFLTMSAAAEAADRATRDYRTIFNAYVHKLHAPKPRIGELAAMQGTITQSFASRYTAKAAGAVEALLSPNPDLEAIRVGIRALGFEDLRGITPTLDARIERAESDPKFIPWLAVPGTFPRRDSLPDVEGIGDLRFDLSRRVGSPQSAPKL